MGASATGKIGHKAGGNGKRCTMDKVEQVIETVFGSAVVSAPLYLVYQFCVYLLN